MRDREYQDYLASEGWRVRKANYFSKHPRVCRICKGKDRIHLHHQTYERVGCERDGDLVALCEFHHDLVHAYYSIGGKALGVCTQEVIAYLTQQYVQRPKRVANRLRIALQTCGHERGTLNPWTSLNPLPLEEH